MCMWLICSIGLEYKSNMFTYRTTTLILSSGVDGALSVDRIATFSIESESRLRLCFMLHVQQTYKEKNEGRKKYRTKIAIVKN